MVVVVVDDSGEQQQNSRTAEVQVFSVCVARKTAKFAAPETNLATWLSQVCGEFAEKGEQT